MNPRIAGLLAVLWFTLPGAALAQEALRFVGDRDYPPLSFLENGEARGFDVEVLREVGRIIGREIHVDLMEWADAQRAVQNGEAVGLTDLAISEERRALYNFAATTLTHDFGLFVRTGDTTIGTLAGVRGRTVGVTSGGFPREFFASRPDVRLVVVENYNAGFDLLLEGRIDALAADVWAGAATVQAGGLKGVVLGGPPFASQPAAIAVRKDQTALLAEIDRAIAVLERNGTIERIRAKWAPQELVFFTRERMRTVVNRTVGAVLAVLLAGTTAWALTLRRQVHVRRAIEAELRESGQRLGLALASASMGTWRFSIKSQQDTRDANLNRMLGLAAVDGTFDSSDIFQRVHEDDREGMRDALERAVRERRTYTREFRIIRPDGSVRVLRGRGKPFYDETGAPDYLTGVAVDITEEVEAEEHRRLLAHALQRASDCIIITDCTRRIVYVNDAFLRTYDYEPEQILGQEVGVLNAPAAPAVMPPPEAADGWRGELMHVSRTGRMFPVALATSVLRGERQEVTAVVSVARDTTTEKLAEDALRASEERFYTAFQASPDGIAIHDVESGAVVSVNEAFQTITGLKRTDLLGHTLSSAGLFAGTDESLAEKLLKSAGRDVELHIRRKTGEAATLTISTAPIEIDGKPAMLTVSRDVTERKRFEIHLRQAAEVNKLLLAEMDLDGLAPAVVEAAHKILALDYAALVLAESSTPPLRLAAQRGVAGSGGAGVAEAIAAATLRDQRVQVMRPADLETLGPVVKPMLAAGLRSVCSLPLATARETAGVLIVGSVRPEAFATDDVTLLQQLGTYVGIAIQNARAYDEIRTLKDQVASEKRYLEEEIRLDHNFADVIGESVAIRRVLQQIETVAPTNASVLLLGETGTGKELLARALHQLSPRKDRTFVRVNAAALPSTLLESELFGYERGAFTGATQNKIGRMELAHRGTLFLDEVGDVPLEVQPKLLRALQEREFERLGSTRTQQVDVRFIAATNRNLQQMVDAGTFRSDLFYRLNVFPVQVPPLRERREDIPLLVRYFVQRFSTQFKRRIESVPAATVADLQSWEWPGNIRELENVIERAVILSNDGVLRIPGMDTRRPAPATRASRPLPDATHEPGAISSFAQGEREIILRALRESQGVVVGAAVRLGIKRTTLQSKMRKLGIRRQSY